MISIWYSRQFLRHRYVYFFYWYAVLYYEFFLEVISCAKARIYACGCPVRRGMGVRRHDPCKCCIVSCALAVTVKRLVDQLFMHYFHNFSPAPQLGGEIWRVGVVHLVVLACVPVFWGQRLKRSSTFLEEKSAPPEKNLATPMNLPTPGKIVRAPMQRGGLLGRHTAHFSTSSTTKLK